MLKQKIDSSHSEEQMPAPTEQVIAEKQDRTIILSLSILAAGLIIAAVIFFRPDLEAAFTQYNATRLANTIYDVPITDQDRTSGPASAPVTVVEYSDFTCPYCRSAQPILAALMEEYGDQLRIVYKDYISVGGQRSAEAAWCAEEQDKFWLYHDGLFSKEITLSHEGYIGLARSLGLDVEQFTQCIDVRKYQGRVEDQTREGAELGVHATPTWFINGKRITGVIDQEAFRAMLIKAGAVAPAR